MRHISFCSNDLQPPNSLRVSHNVTKDLGTIFFYPTLKVSPCQECAEQSETYGSDKPVETEDDVAMLFTGRKFACAVRVPNSPTHTKKISPRSP